MSHFLCRSTVPHPFSVLPQRRSAGKERCRSGGFDGGKGSSLQRRPRHRRTQSDGGGGGRVDLMEKVVKQTEDPPGDFRRSMLQMIVEKEILGGEELRQLLYCFIALNSPSHHALIVRAFSDIWRDVISGYGRNIPRAADLLVPAPVLRHGLPPPRRPATGRAGRSRSPTRSAWGCEGVPEPLLQRLLQLLGRPPRREHPSHLAGRPRSDRGPGLVRLLRHGGKPCQVPGDRAEPGVLRLPVLPHAEQVRRPRL